MCEAFISSLYSRTVFRSILVWIHHWKAKINKYRDIIRVFFSSAKRTKRETSRPIHFFCSCSSSKGTTGLQIIIKNHDLITPAVFLLLLLNRTDRVMSHSWSVAECIWQHSPMQWHQATRMLFSWGKKWQSLTFLYRSGKVANI